MLKESVSMQQHFENFLRKQRRVELKSVGNFVAKTMLVESANQFSRALYGPFLKQCTLTNKAVGTI